MAQKIKKYILSQLANKNLTLESAKDLLLDLGKANENKPLNVAVIGMAGRFPKADNLNEFWDNLKNGVNCISDLPENRKKDAYNILKNNSFSEFIYGKVMDLSGNTDVFLKGGYLNEIDCFDSEFFNIPPIEALYMDPYHRIALEVAWEAMEDAGYGGEALVGSRTGIYMGKEGTNYSFYKYTSEPNHMQLTGSWESLMISRISHLFDFKGPCMNIDTACSSGLVSVHLALQALHAGECDQALAGGINISISGEVKSAYRAVNMGDVEKEDGIVRTFDFDSNGTAWGEGIGIVLLKPLEKALKDGDHIYAVIKGSAINNDGHSNSLTAPSAETQKDVIMQAWKNACIPPRSITYIEAHGTGTKLGDPIEMKALADAFESFTNHKQFCGIGSLKTSMGHMVGAAGAASLIKVVLALNNKTLPPMTNFSIPNPHIDFVESPVYINNSLASWETGDIPRRAGLSSFGFSRTNCHMVVEQAPLTESADSYLPYYCLTISAMNKDAMLDYIKKYTAYVNNRTWSLADICYTSNIGRGHYKHRTVIIASTREELVERLTAAFLKKENDWVFHGSHTIVSSRKDRKEIGEFTRVEIEEHSNEAKEKLNIYIKNGMKDIKLLREVCLLYARNANIEWNVLYRGEKRRRLSIPTYPFKKTRYWALTKISSLKFESNKILHPLVEYNCTSNSSSEIRYETTFSVDKQWALSDHLINGNAILPGTSYLEMIRFVLENERDINRFEFKNVCFLVPLIVNEACKVYISLLPNKDTEGYKFNFFSADSDVHHVQGEISLLHKNLTPERVDINKMKESANEVSEYKFNPTETEGFLFGPHWDNIRMVWHMQEESLVKLQLLEKHNDEIKSFKLHPALLDNAVNFRSQDSGDVFLPFMYKSLKLYHPLTNVIYTHIKPRKEKLLSDETIIYDINIFDEKGTILVEIKGYTVKKVKNLSLLGKETPQGSCSKMTWIPKIEENLENHGTIKAMKWGMIATGGERSEELHRVMIERGYHVEIYHILSEDEIAQAKEKSINKIFTEIENRNYDGIIFASDYSIKDNDLIDLINNRKYFKNIQTVGVDAFFHLCKMILIHKTKTIKTIKVIVRDSALVDGKETMLSPFSAATVGLSKVFAQEYTNISVDVLDVSGELEPEAFVDELFKGSGVRAIRNSGLFEQELRPHYISIEEQLPVRKDGVYIISGGLGGIGLTIAEHLANKGRVNVVLVGRRSIKPIEQWKEFSEKTEEAELYKRLLFLRENLNTIEYISLDVTNKESVLELKNLAEKKYKDIIGIFHAAGVAGDGYLMLKDDAKYREVMEPKLDGTMNLVGLLENKPNRFMFVFSSITALTGGQGQGDYCAANAFVDTLAEFGRLRGMHISSLNWSLWENIGMSASFSVDQEEGAFPAIDSEEALRWMEHMLIKPESAIIPCRLDYNKLNKHKAILPFKFSGSDPIKTDKSIPELDKGNFERDIIVKGVTNPTDVQRVLANELGNLLGLHEVDVYSSFSEMGGNSLMSTQYLSRIESKYQDIVHISDIFSYPTIYELAEYISSRIKNLSQEEKEVVANSESVDNIVDLFKEELDGTDLLKEFMDEMNRV